MRGRNGCVFLFPQSGYGEIGRVEETSAEGCGYGKNRCFSYNAGTGGRTGLCRIAGRAQNPNEHGGLGEAVGWLFRVQWQRVADRAGKGVLFINDRKR